MKTSLDVINAGVGALRSLYEGYPTSSVAVIRSMTKEEQDTLYDYLKQLSYLCWQEITRRGQQKKDREWLKRFANEEDKIEGD